MLDGWVHPSDRSPIETRDVTPLELAKRIAFILAQAAHEEPVNSEGR